MGKGQTTMRRLLTLTLFLAVAGATLCASAAEAQKLRVVTSTTDLKASGKTRLAARGDLVLAGDDVDEVVDRPGHAQ